MLSDLHTKVAHRWPATLCSRLWIGGFASAASMKLSLKHVTTKYFGSNSSIGLAWRTLVVGTVGSTNGDSIDHPWTKRIESSYRKKIQS